MDFMVEVSSSELERLKEENKRLTDALNEIESIMKGNKNE